MEKKVLTPEELQSLREIERKQSDLMFKLGQLEYQRVILKNDVQFLENENLRLGKLLTEKYGEGKISLETGKITIE
jgi:hypothetical protein